MSHRIIRKPRILKALFLISLGLAVHASGASELRFVVTGVDAERGGTIDAGLYASEDGYLEPGYQIASVSVPVEGEDAEGAFTDLPAGRYVIAILHDENGDHEMQTRGALGIPEEGYGFSGPDKAKMKPPKFDKAAVSLDGSSSADVVIFMKYM